MTFSAGYRRATRAAHGVCPIESGLVGKLADNECPHGYLPTDRVIKCECWKMVPSLSVKELRARRQMLGLTTHEVAAAAGITHGGLSKIELGMRNPRPETLKAIAEALA